MERKAKEVKEAVVIRVVCVRTYIGIISCLVVGTFSHECERLSHQGFFAGTINVYVFIWFVRLLFPQPFVELKLSSQTRTANNFQDMWNVRIYSIAKAT